MHHVLRCKLLPVVTDGPFTESTEVPSGCDVMEVETLDYAIAMAAELPAPSATGARVDKYPPTAVSSPSGTYTSVDAPCTPGVMARLAPLGAYTVHGPVVAEIGGTIVGSRTSSASTRAGSANGSSPPRPGRSAADCSTNFLLDRVAHEPQPSPEVSRALRLLERPA